MKVFSNFFLNNYKKKFTLLDSEQSEEYISIIMMHITLIFFFFCLCKSPIGYNNRSAY